ncbi:MAG: sigma-54-dependent Fis family transcriptional regulator [Verrucomicrobia bacterium]|nr:sigma-54-dependent Fis family transcriptional regulator [Verrucomicrobiota bacterium]
MSTQILVVDDEPGIRSMLEKILAKAGYAVSEADSGAALKNLLGSAPPDLVLLDLKLPDASGLDLLDLMKQQWPETEVVVLTGFATIESAVLAIKKGAYDFLAKPFDHQGLLQCLHRAMERRRLRQETSALRQALSGMSGGVPHVFESTAMRKILRLVERIAPSDVPVLITGESGVGKEIVADLLHALSPRAKAPFIKANSALLPPEVIESDFATLPRSRESSKSRGVFHQAEGGTLLLDEIAEMPPETQSMLLRVLQEKEARPSFGAVPVRTHCRVVATTNRKVDEAIQTGKLRKDLFFRVSAVTIEVPPLRDRREDILPLAGAFLKRYAAQSGRAVEGFTPTATEALRNFDWPGNVRQLQNQVQRAVLTCEGSQLDTADLLTNIEEVPAAKANLSLMEGVERNMIVQVLRETGGNKLKAAQRLGIGRQTLYNKIKSYEIET